MGYLARRTYRLVFADEVYDGLEVDVTSPSLSEYFQMVEARENPDSESFDELLKTLSKNLSRWNLVDETGAPVPVTVDGLSEIDLDILKSILDAWVEVLTGASGPLGRRSSSGEISAESSTPGPGSLSESQLSLLATSSSPPPA